MQTVTAALSVKYKSFKKFTKKFCKYLMKLVTMAYNLCSPMLHIHHVSPFVLLKHIKNWLVVLNSEKIEIFCDSSLKKILFPRGSTDKCAWPFSGCEHPEMFISYSDTKQHFILYNHIKEISYQELAQVFVVTKFGLEFKDVLIKMLNN